LELDFTVAPRNQRSEQPPRPLSLLYFQMIQWNLPNLLIFISKTAIFKVSHLIIFKDYIQRD